MIGYFLSTFAARNFGLPTFTGLYILLMTSHFGAFIDDINIYLSDNSFPAQLDSHYVYLSVIRFALSSEGFPCFKII